jgi:hypothetical protein
MSAPYAKILYSDYTQATVVHFVIVAYAQSRSILSFVRLNVYYKDYTSTLFPAKNPVYKRLLLCYYIIYSELQPTFAFITQIFV